VSQPNGERPIFVLSAGWRSGSTLLQRLVMSSRTVLIWGEPFGDHGLISGLASSLGRLRGYGSRGDVFVGGRSITSLSNDWVANLAPTYGYLVSAHRAFFEQLFAQPSAAQGIKRWGIKEVRWGAEEALYLRWLYPDAQFLFLVRDPLEAYRSYRKWRCWYARWPDKPVFTPTAFGRLWRQLTSEFRQVHQELGAQIIRYEDLVGGQVSIEALSRYLDLSLDPAVISKRVGSSAEPRRLAQNPKAREVTAIERTLLKHALAGSHHELGYTW
jgi:hypothetical protein